ncbi:MAG TPA: DUF3302 domain-containing protein [Desulfobulbaceae bacterium]|nr:DUF3302 domain-containing protein [Desulfobulbaceae bacterium]
MAGRGLDYAALVLLIIISITLVYAIIYIHDIPYNIAKKRNHPHQDAIHTAGWVSLFLMHTLWPFLWIWATMYRPDRGWGMGDSSGQPDAGAQQADFTPEALACELAQVKERLARLERTMQTTEKEG